MKKEEFLHRLREKLAVLEEKEREDILNEYEQHIDMKAAGAMTQEEAIADFGDMDELAAQILEAYHVRADYGQTVQSQKKDGILEGVGETALSAWHRFCDACDRNWKRFLESLRRIGLRIEAAGKRLLGFRDVKAAKPDGNQAKAPKESRLQYSHKKKNPLAGCCSKLWKGCTAIWSWCFAAAVWCIRLLWNLFWISSGLVLGLGACFCLFGLGTVCVLLAIGYPLLGVTVGLLGLTLAMVSVTGLCFTFLVRHKTSAKREKAAEELCGQTEKEACKHA